MNYVWYVSNGLNDIPFKTRRSCFNKNITRQDVTFKNNFFPVLDLRVRVQAEEGPRGHGQHPGGELHSAVAVVLAVVADQPAADHLGRPGGIQEKGEREKVTRVKEMKDDKGLKLAFMSSRGEKMKKCGCLRKKKRKILCWSHIADKMLLLLLYNTCVAATFFCLSDL